MRARRAGQGELRPLICVSTPEEPAGRMPRPEERSPHLRGRLGTLGDLLERPGLTDGDERRDAC